MLVRKIVNFAKKETVLFAAVLLAFGSMVCVPPDMQYLSYIDYRVLALLFCLMTVMEGFKSTGFFAAVAGIGFGAISDPPLRAFKMIAILAALGHACRFCLMTYLGVDIATASLFAGLVIGFGSLWLGKRVYCPMTVLYIPALLPMIPGKFAYNMVFSLIMCLQNMNDPEQLDKFMGMFFSNSLIASTVIFMLAVGATFPMFLFPHRAFSLTRH